MVTENLSTSIMAIMILATGVAAPAKLQPG